MYRANNDIRMYAKENGVTLWMIAEKLNVSEPTITRWFRVELEEKKKADIRKVIDEIAFHR